VLDIDGSRDERASSWHTEVTFVADYPKISILRGVVVPEAGGDTLVRATNRRAVPATAANGRRSRWS
jgi:alpha-ketoglutarate-dependent taurine dioxygenase